MLDTGGHQAVIKDLTFTPDGKYLVSAGEDKVIRVWDWQAGKTVRTIRGQVGQGPEGKIFAMALSPDGRWLAVGGWTGGNEIRLYDFASGRLHALLKGHGDVVNALTFSFESKKLISGSADRTAIIWDVGSAKVLHTLRGHQAQIYGVSFLPDGERAVTASFDNTLGLWSVADGKLIKDMRGHGDKVWRVTVSSKDGTIASGDGSGEIRLWDGKTGAFLRSFARQGDARQGDYVGSLKFSPDGSLLLSTCSANSCGFKQRVFKVASGKDDIAYAKHDYAVLASAFSPDGSLVATGGGSNYAIHIWDPRTSETKGPPLKGTSRLVLSAAFSADSRQIAWGQTFRGTPDINNHGPLEMTLRLPDAGEAIGEPTPVANQQGFVRAQARLSAWSLQHRQGGAFGYDAILEILQDGQVKARIERGPTDGYSHRSYAFTPDGQTVISGGGNGHLNAYGLDGKKIGNFIGHEGDVWAVAVSPDGKYLVSGSADQTVRL